MDDLKSFITVKWGIPKEQILILLPYGSILKKSVFESYLAFDHLDTDNSQHSAKSSSESIQKEFIVYDRRLFSSLNQPTELSMISETTQDDEEQNDGIGTDMNSSSYLSLHRIMEDTRLVTELAHIKPVESPLITLKFEQKDPNLRQNIATALTTNLGWVSALVIDVHYMKYQIQDLSNEISLIVKCLFTADQYLKTYSSEVEELYNSNVVFLQQLTSMKADSKWQNIYDNILSRLPGPGGKSIQQFVDKENLLVDTQNIEDLDSQINLRLIELKKDIDMNFNYRDIILKNIHGIENIFNPSKKDYELETTMLVKFNEMVDEIKKKSHNILEEDISSIPLGVELQNTADILDVEFKSIVKTLHTISQALYVKVDEFLQFKKTLQHNCIKMLGQISFSQMSILHVKKILLSECNTKLKNYQNIVTHFTRVEDLPLIYGLYLIELGRRDVWVERIYAEYSHIMNSALVATENEAHARHTWQKLYGVVSDIFDTGDTTDTAFANLKKMFLSKENALNISHSISPIYQRRIQDDFKQIEGYITDLEDTIIDKDIVHILKEKWTEVNKFHKSYPVRVIGDYNRVDEEIAYYRGRVHKLEDLLHDHILGTKVGWPFQLLPVSRHVASSDLSTIALLSAPNTVAFTTTATDKQVIDRANYPPSNDSNTDDTGYQKKIANQDIQISDLHLEIITHKETLRHLNNELLSLTTDLENSKKIQMENDLSYKAHITQLVTENSRLLKDGESLTNQLILSESNERESLKTLEELQTMWEMKEREYKHEIEELTEKLKQTEDQQLNQNMTVELIDASNQTNEYIETYNEIGVQTDTFPLFSDVTEMENGDNEAEDSDININNEENVTHNIRESNKITINNEKKVFNINESSCKDLFRVFRKNIYILENIGLLLTTEEAYKTPEITELSRQDIFNNNLVIKRVKGLKRVVTKSLLNTTSHLSSELLKNDEQYLIQSPVFKVVDELYTELIHAENSNIESLSIELCSLIEQVYSRGLYERAVIRRFSDVEILAKKLSKEVKFTESAINRITEERIAVRDFKIGDIALFLPMKEDAVNESIYRIPSGNSSLSSVDLSSPQRSKVITAEDKSKERAKQIDLPRPVANTDKRPWAAFTTSKTEVRYFYSSDNNMSVGEWFLGKITHMQLSLVLPEHVNDLENNPYKLPNGTIWFKVNADIVATGYA